MKEQLKLLIELQVHDAKIQELEGALKAFPARFESMQSDVKRVETLLDKERSQLTETESWRKRQEQEARDQEDALIKAKQRAGMVKNVKEHMASERDLEANRKSAAAREEEAARLTGAVASARTTLAQHEGDLETMRQHVSSQVEDARAEMTSIEEKIAAVKTERDVAAAAVDAQALKRYSTIRMRRGLALAPVKAGTCQGCHMNIPPQLFNVLQRGTTIETCPNCYRIIYWDKLLMDADGLAAEKREADAKLIEKKPTRVAKPRATKSAPAASASMASGGSAAAVRIAPRVDLPKGPAPRLAAPAGSEPGAGVQNPAELRRSSTESSPDTATGASAPPRESVSDADDSTAETN